MRSLALAVTGVLLFAGCDQAAPASSASAKGEDAPLVRSINGATLNGTSSIFTTTAPSADAGILAELKGETTETHFYFDDLQLRDSGPLTADVSNSEGDIHMRLTSLSEPAEGSNLVKLSLGGTSAQETADEEVVAVVQHMNGEETRVPLDADACRSDTGCEIASLQDNPDSVWYHVVCRATIIRIMVPPYTVPKVKCDVDVGWDYHTNGTSLTPGTTIAQGSTLPQRGIRELGIQFSTIRDEAIDASVLTLTGYEALSVYNTERF